MGAMAPELGREAHVFFLAVFDRRKEARRMRRADLLIGRVLRTSFCSRFSSISTERSLVLGKDQGQDVDSVMGQEWLKHMIILESSKNFYCWEIEP